MSSGGYPKVHVVGSGAYYAYRPITRNIEKVSRNYYRDAASRPKEFGQYMAASTSMGERGISMPRGSSMPPETKRSEEDRKFPQRKTSDAFFKSCGADDDFMPKRRIDRSFASALADEPVLRRRDDACSKAAARRKVKSSYINQSTEEESTMKSARQLSSSTSVDDTLTRLRRNHPFRLPVEDEKTVPHESSIWPENRPHFDLVSSYDVMVDYLGIRDKSKK